MTVRNVKKQLLGMQDILQGVGTTTQTRNSQSYSIARVDVPYSVNSEAELSALDTTLYTRSRIYASTSVYAEYIFDAAALAGIAPDSGSGFWVATTPAQSVQSSILFNSLADVIAGTLPSGASIALSINNQVTVKERVTGNQGGASWLVVDATGVTNNDIDIVLLSASLSLVLVVEETMNTKQFGAVHDNTANDSAALLQAIASCKLNNFVLFFSPGQALIDSNTTLNVDGNMHIEFLAGSFVKMIDNSASVYTVMNISGSNNYIVNLSLVGDRIGHSGAASDTCVCLLINGGVTLINPVINSAWGHGVRVQLASEVNINSLAVENCGGHGVVIEEVTTYISFAGTTYIKSVDKTGLQLQPLIDTSSMVLINIESLSTLDCVSFAVNVDLSSWPNGGDSHNTTINIGSHYDNGSFVGFNIAPMALGLTENLTGLISVQTAVYLGNGNQGIYLNNYSAENTPRIYFNYVDITDANRLNSSNEVEQTAIGMLQSTQANTVGNFTVDHLRVVDNRVTQRCRTALYADDTTFPAVGMAEVFITVDSIDLDLILAVEIDSDGLIVNDPNKLLHVDLTGLGTGKSEGVVTSVSCDSATTNFSLASNNDDNAGNEIEFTVAGSGSIRIIPDGAVGIIRPLTLLAAKYVESTLEGSYLRIKRGTELQEWYVTSQTGTWTVEP